MNEELLELYRNALKQIDGFTKDDLRDDEAKLLGISDVLSVTIGEAIEIHNRAKRRIFP